MRRRLDVGTVTVARRFTEAGARRFTEAGARRFTEAGARLPSTFDPDVSGRLPSARTAPDVRSKAGLRRGGPLPAFVT